MAAIDQRQQQVQTQTNVAENAGNVLSGEFHFHAAPPTPLQALRSIPAPPRDFTGRESDLNVMLAAFERGATISGVRGLGGVGKTALACKLAERLAPRYPDGSLFVELYGARPQPVTTADAMKTLLRALFGAEARLPENEPELRNLYRSALHGKRFLLLLDDAKDRAHVEPLLPSASCGVLITSRQKFALPGLQAHDLDALPPEEARALLLAICPRIGELAEELARLCGCLPLALRAAGSALAERSDLSPAAYRRRLEQAQTRLSLIDASLSLSYDLLAPEQQTRWAALAVFPADFDAAAAAAVWNMDADAAQDALSELVKWSIVEFADDRYRLHDLARLFAAARLNKAGIDLAQQRHAIHYQFIARYADINLYLQGGESVLIGLKLFDVEWPNIQTGHAWAENNAEISKIALELCDDYPTWCYNILPLRQHPRQRIAWLEIALNAAKKLGRKQAIGWHLGNLGLAYADVGEPRRAIEYYEQHLVIAREIGDRCGEGNALGNLGSAYYLLGEPRRAIEYYEQCLILHRETGDRRGEGNALGGLGIAYWSLGEPCRAIEYYEQCLILHREIGDRRGEGNDLGNLGLAYKNLGEPRRAIEYYEQALIIAREIGDRRGEGVDLGNLGLAYSDVGEPRRAIEYYEQALSIAREIGDRRGEGVDLGNLGLAYSDLGEPRRAIEYHEQRLVIAREIVDRRGEGNALGNLGVAYSDLGEPRRAIEYYEQQLTIVREIGDRRGEGNALGNLGLAYWSLGEPRRAIEYYEQQLTIVREIGDRRGEGNDLGNLGNAYSELNEREHAIQYYEQALVIRQAIGDQRGEGNDLWNMSLTLDTLGERARAIELAAAALVIYEQIEDPNAEQVRRALAAWRGETTGTTIRKDPRKRWWQFWK